MSHIQRSKYIGGSDAAKLVGKHGFSTPRHVYEMLLDGDSYEEEDLSENRHIKRGNFCEPIALRRIREEYPTLNEESVEAMFDQNEDTEQIYLEHPDFDFIAGHVDGISADPFGAEAIVHEVKAPTSSSIDFIERRGIPDRYFYQLQHYMGIAAVLQPELEVQGKLQIWDCDQWDVRTIEVEHRPDLWADLVELYVSVWEDAQAGVAFEDTDLDYPAQERETHTSPYLRDLMAEYHEVHTKYKESKERKTELKSKILSQLNGESRITGEDFYATVKYYDNSTHLSVKEKS